MRALPGVASAALAVAVPFGDFHEGHSVERVGGPARPDLTRASNATYRVIGTDYFRTLNLPMVRGREFTDAEEDCRRRRRASRSSTSASRASCSAPTIRSAR